MGHAVELHHWRASRHPGFPLASPPNRRKHSTVRSPIKLLLASWLLVGPVSAQIVVPANPGKFKGRTIGGGSTGGVEVIPKDSGAPQKVRYTTYITLAESRPWTSTEGKVIEGTLIAFEDVVIEGTQGAAPPAAPEPPKHPTVVRGEKIRLLVNRKPVELPLSRLSRPDQEFIANLKAAHAPK